MCNNNKTQSLKDACFNMADFTKRVRLYNNLVLYAKQIADAVSETLAKFTGQKVLRKDGYLYLNVVSALDRSIDRVVHTINDVTKWQVTAVCQVKQSPINNNEAEFLVYPVFFTLEGEPESFDFPFRLPDYYIDATTRILRSSRDKGDNSDSFNELDEKTFPEFVSNMISNVTMFAELYLSQLRKEVPTAFHSYMPSIVLMCDEKPSVHFKYPEVRLTKGMLEALITEGLSEMKDKQQQERKRDSNALKATARLKCLNCSHRRLKVLKRPLTTEEIKSYATEPYEVAYCRKCQNLTLHQYLLWQ